MDITNIAQLVGTLGFPIVCCGALFWALLRVMSTIVDRIIESNEKVAESVNNNTIAVIALKENLQK